jgi:hypothetical protein
MVGLLGRVISLSQVHYLHTRQFKHRINAYTQQTSMPWVGFEPTIAAPEQAKAVNALDRATTVTPKARLIINLKHYVSVILATLFLRIKISFYHAIVLMYCTLLGHWWAPIFNLLRYWWHRSICYTRLFLTPLVVVTVSLLQWVLTLMSCLRAVPWSLVFCLECWQLTDWLTVIDSWQNRTEQSRAVAYCRQPASTVIPGIKPLWDPWPYICSMSRLLFSSFFRCSPFDKKGVDLPDCIENTFSHGCIFRCNNLVA